MKAKYKTLHFTEMTWGLPDFRNLKKGDAVFLVKRVYFRENPPIAEWTFSFEKPARRGWNRTNREYSEYYFGERRVISVERRFKVREFVYGNLSRLEERVDISVGPPHSPVETALRGSRPALRPRASARGSG